MAPANPLPLDQPVEPLDRRDLKRRDTDRRDTDHRDTDGPNSDRRNDEQLSLHAPEPVPPDELNAWRRGFTPQAEIWNGRLAMLGLSVGLTVLLLARLLATRPS
jgi:hypothetical protein